MSQYTFKHGIHPNSYKDASKDIPIKDFSPKGLITIMMQQHIGAPCKPLVKAGDEVLLGQKIGDSENFVSAPVHSSVSGKVKRVTKLLHPSGNMVDAVILENDNEYRTVDFKPLNPDKISKEEIVDKIKEAGIVGMGGAGFPTHIKLKPPKGSKIDYVILNGAECEPFITADYRMMLEYSMEIVKGLDIILKLFPDAQGIVGIEDNKPDAIKVMEDAVKDFANPNIKVISLKTKYPQGAEKQLINAGTGRIVPSGKLPADVGCIVQNIDTTYEIYRAIYDGRPLTERVLTISGDALEKPMNYNVPLGTSYLEIVEDAGGEPDKAVKIINGGPMMGMAMFDLNVPTIKTSSSILLLTEKIARIVDEGPCIKCGKCVSACPMFLLPLELDKFSRFNHHDKFEEYHGLDCIECGSCSFVCPAKRHLVHSIRVTKRKILLQKRR